MPSTIQSINYNAFNKAICLKDTVDTNAYQLDIQYGPDQQRWRSVLKKNGSDIKTIIFADDYEKFIDNGVTREMYYIGAPDGLAAIYVNQQNGPATMYYVHKDHLGSIVSLTDNEGVAVFSASYDAWGKQTVSLNTIGFYRGYTGHEHLPEFGLINMNGRMYDPVLGRFLSPDNYVQAVDFSQSFNRYSYCVNNPLRYTDPSGDLFWIIPNISFSPNGGLNFSLTFGVGVPGAFGGQLTVGGGAGGFNVTAGGFLGSANAYVGYSSSGGFIAGAGLGFGGLPNGFNTNMTGVGVNYSSRGGLSFNMSAVQFDTYGNMNIDPSIGYSRMIYTSKESSISEISAAGMGVVPKEIAKVGTDAQKDTFLKRMGVKLSSFGVESVQMENKVFPKEMNGYKRWEDGIITNKKVEPVGGVTYSKGGWFPHSTIFMSPHNTERNFAISLNHEFIHAWQWQQFGNRMSKSEWEAYMEPSAYSYTNMYYSGFDKQVLYNGILNLYNWPTNLIKVP